MADFTGGKVDFDAMASSPAAPKGLKQEATRLGNGLQRWKADPSTNAPWMPQESMLETAGNWYGGGNAEGMKNGWDTKFYRQFLRQDEEWATKAQTAAMPGMYYQQFDTTANPTATGVAAWDDPNGKFQFGDIFQNGKRVSNIYETFDKATADVMMGELLFSRNEKVRSFDDKNPARYAEKVQTEREKNSEYAKFAPQQDDFQRAVRAKEEDYHEGWEKPAMVGTSAAATGVMAGSAAAAVTSAAIAAGVTSWTGPGALVIGGVAGLVGGVVGGISAWMNQDELVEQAARSSVIAQRANERFEGLQQPGALGFGLKEYSKVGMKLISPASNAVHGWQDELVGAVGDREAGWYAVDPVTKNLKRSNAMTGLDIVASIGDGALQFSSAPGRAMYMGTMGGVTLGGAGAMTTGYGWNDWQGGFDKYDDWKEWSAATASVGIDAVQVGTAGVLGRAMRHSRQSAGLESVVPGGAMAQSKLTPRWLKDQLAKRDEGEVIDGIRYTTNLNSKGEVTREMRMTMAWLAPSEALRMIPVGFRARQMTAAGKVTTADDYYNAAIYMTSRGRFRDALLMGYAEGGEEFVQGILDPMAFSENVDPRTLTESFLYGFAGGAGMSAGRINRGATAAQQLEARARTNYQLRNNDTIVTDDEWTTVWGGMSKEARAALAIPTPEEDAMIRQVMSDAEEGMRQSQMYSPLGVHIVDLMKEAQVRRDLAGGNRVGGNSLTWMGIHGGYVFGNNGLVEKVDLAPNAAVMSFEETMSSLFKTVSGLRLKFERFTDDKKKFEAQVSDGTLTQEQRETAQTNLDRVTGWLDDLAVQNRVSQELLGSKDRPGLLLGLFEQYKAATDPAAKSAAIDTFNKLVRKIYSGQGFFSPSTRAPYNPQELEAAKKTVEIILDRHPLMGAGSFSAWFPHASAVLSVSNMHGTVHTDQGPLKAAGGDHDGDNKVAANEVYFDPDRLLAVRRGAQYLDQVSTMPKPDSSTGDVVTQPLPASKWKVVIGVPDSEGVFIRTFGDPALTTAQKSLVDAGLTRLRNKFLMEYSGILPMDLTALLDTFEQEVKARVVDARVHLVEGLFNLDAQALLDKGEKAGVPEALNMWKMISTAWDEIQQSFAYEAAAHLDDIPMAPNAPPVPEDNSELKRVARQQAAVAGIALSMLGASSPVRGSQFLHYMVQLASTTVLEPMDTATLQGVAGQMGLAKLYENLSSGQTQTDSQALDNRNVIESRVRGWLEDFVKEVESQGALPVTVKRSELMLLLGNLRVPDMQRMSDGEYGFGDSRISLTQLLLRRSLDIEEARQANADKDSDVQKKINKLRRLTVPEAEHSKTAALAAIEVFQDESSPDLVGDASFYFGPQMTPRQIVKLLMSKGPRERSSMLADLKRAPHYFSHRETPDPPWDYGQLYATNEDLSNGRGPEINGYTTLIDMIQTAVSSEIAKREQKANETLRDFKTGFTRWQETLDAWRKTYTEEMLKAKNADLPEAQWRSTVTDEEVMLNLLQQRPDVAKDIARLIPEAARMAVFDAENGQVTHAKWLTSVLLEREVDRALVKYHVMSKLAEFNVLQGTVDTAKLDGRFNEATNKRLEVKDVSIDDLRGAVRLGQIDSRYLETIWYLRQLKDGGQELRRFIHASLTADSLEQLYTQINNEPMWLAGRAKMHPFDDSRSSYELNPADVWRTDSTTTDLREAVTNFTRRMTTMSEVTLSEMNSFAEDNIVVTRMKAERAEQLRTTPTPGRQVDTQAKANLEALEQTLLTRTLFPDSVGPKARKQLMDAMQDLIFSMHNKGTADAHIEPVGAALITADMFGFGDATRLELSSLTSWSWDQILSNPTLLTKGPVRLMFNNGTMLELDVSTVDGALDMLSNPITKPFANAVLFATTRDVNSMNAVQLYMDTESTRLADLLEDVSHASLFNKGDSDESQLLRDYRLLGMVDAYARNVGNKAGTDEAAEQGFFPIQKMLNRMIVAYQTSAGRGRSQAAKDDIRDQAVRDVAKLLRMIERLPKSQHKELRDRLTIELQEQYWQDSTLLDEIVSQGGAALKAGFRSMIAQEFKDEQVRIAVAIANTTDQDELDKLNDELEASKEAFKQFTNSDDLGIARKPHMSVDAVLRMFKLSHDPADVLQDVAKKGAIANFLGSQERINKFRGEKGAVTVTLRDKSGMPILKNGDAQETEISFAGMIAKFTELAWKPRGGTLDINDWSDVSVEEWDQLAYWAMSLYISERVTRSAADTKISLLTLGKDVDELAQMYDTSWGFLIEPLFDDSVLKAMDTLATTAVQGGLTNAKDVANLAMHTIYNPQKLGRWNDRVPMMMLKANKALDGAAVRVSVAAGGVNPMEMNAWIASGTPTFETPEAAHFSTANLVVAKGASLESAFTEETYLKLHNHFVSDVQLIPASTGVAQPIFDLTAAVDLQNDEVRNSGLRVLSLPRLIEMLRDPSRASLIADGYEIVVTYVDVDKKPDGAKWANNTFFEGVGRNWEARGGQGLIEAMFFGTNGLNSVAQQLPLDSLTKKGRAFRVFITTVLSKVKSLESRGTITEIMRAKAWHMILQPFPNGQLGPDDLPAIYKWVKSRHVVVGNNHVTGDKEVWPVDKYIERESHGQPVQLDNAKLVPLSEKVAQTLLGGGSRGVEGDAQMPVLNSMEGPNYPSFGLTRLKELGLERIGEDVTVRNSEVGRFTSLSRASLDGKDSERKDIRSPQQMRLELWVSQREPHLTHRMNTRGTRQGQFNIEKMRAAGFKKLGEMLKIEELANILSSFNVPMSFMKSVTSHERSQRVYGQVEKLLGSNGTIWQYVQGADNSDLATGVVTEVDLEKGFSSEYPPVYGDMIVVDLTSIRKSVGGDPTAAMEQAQKVLSALTQRGLIVALAGTESENYFREYAAELLTSGEFGYKKLEGASNFFEPITDSMDIDATVEALRSTLVETTPVAAKNLTVNFSTNAFTSLSEAVRFINTGHSRLWRRAASMILPSNMQMGSTASDNVYAFGVPGTGAQHNYQFEKAADKILEYVANGGRQDLLDRMGDYPEDMPLYEEHNDNSYTPGIRDKERALDLFLDALSRGVQLIDKGEQCMSGDLYMVVTSDGSILINRIGFKLPDMRDKGDIISQWERGGLDGLRLAFRQPAIEALQTTLPPFEVFGHRSDYNGISVYGEHPLSVASKTIREGTGNKTTSSPMPPGLQFAGPLSDNGIWVESLTGEVGDVEKSGLRWTVNNFADLFALTGVNFRELMVEFFFGDTTDFETKYNLLDQYLKAWASYDHNLTVDQVADLMDMGGGISKFMAEADALGQEILGNAYQPFDSASRSDMSDPKNRIAQVIMLTLTAPGVTPDMVMSLPGLLSVKNPSGESQVGWLPRVMSQGLSDTKYPAVQEFLIAQANASMPKSMAADGKMRPVAQFDADFKAHVRMTQELSNGSKKELVEVGYLQLETALVADENPIMFAFSTKDKRPVSEHNTHTVNAIGGVVAMKPPKRDKDGKALPTAVEELGGDNTIMRFEQDEETLWDLLSRIMPETTETAAWMRRTPMQAINVIEADKEVKRYSKPIDKTDWTKDAADNPLAIKALEKGREFLKMGGLDTERDMVEVDYLVRQWYGAPGLLEDDEQVYDDRISAKMYLDAVSAMMENMAEGMHPLHAAEVPWEHSVFWHKLFLAKKWSPVRKPGDGVPASQSWGEWVAILSSQVRESEELFDGMFRTALDGFYFTYQGSSPSFQTMALSTDEKRAAKFLDPETNEPFFSMDPGVDKLLANPVILDSMKMTWAVIAGHDAATRREDSKSVPMASKYQRSLHRNSWRKKNKMARQKRANMVDYFRDGVHHQESMRDSNNFMRLLIHMSLTTRLANPALWTSQILEIMFRSRIDDATALLAGTYAGGGSQAINAAARAMKLTPRFSKEDLVSIDNMAEQLGRSDVMRGELFGELSYESKLVEPSGIRDAEGNMVPSGGKVSRFFEKSATWASRMFNDPSLGQTRKAAMRRYILAAIEYFDMTNNEISIQALEQLIEADPLWIMKQSPGARFNAHKAGVHTVGQNRSNKATVVGDLIMRPIETLGRSDSTAAAIAGGMLKIPFLFTRFNMNALITLTGLTALDQALAMALTGRDKPGQTFAKWMGEKAKQDPKDAKLIEKMDFSDGIETLDLGRLVLRGAVTQTGLMAAGLLGANLFGLGGDDEETRRRKRMATYMKTPFIYDPNKSQNDFRSVGAIYLDNVPVLGALFENETGRSPVIPHWILQQFTSPMMGVVRFLETGNPQEIMYGFNDAISALPYSVMNTFRDADMTASLLAEEAAKKEAGIDTAEKRNTFMWLMMNIVGTYERALIENQFVNTIRSAFDEVDRNPWLVPATKMGEIVKQDGTNYPVQTDTMQPYQSDEIMDPTTGQVLQDPQNRTGYMVRHGWDGMLHQYAENNTTAMVLLSLVTGQLGSESTYMRSNMVPRSQDVPVGEANKDLFMRLVRANFLGQGGQERLTKDEIKFGLRYQYESANIRWNAPDIEKQASAMYRAQNDAEYAPSIVGKDGKEKLTTEGMRGVLRSVKAGMLKLGDPALAGIWMSMEDRDIIAAAWQDEIVQEGVNMGLSEESAKYRLKRLWLGDLDDPGSPGLREIIYSDKIPSKPTAEYFQLNVTHVIGPDGRPWATPFTRSSAMQALGFPVPTTMRPPAPGMTMDERGNTVDPIRGINTGRAALMPKPIEPEKIKPNDDILKKTNEKKYTASGYGGGWYSRGWGGFSRFYRGGYGGGGGYSGGGYSGSSSYPSKMPWFGDIGSARINTVGAINTSNPIIRRSDVRRERYSSERGRLKQWQ